MKRRIAISMRVVQSEHGEWRDALAQDWGVFLKTVLPECFFVPIPNSGKDAVALARELHLNGLILTGGDDLGIHPQRDSTEEQLFYWAKEQAFPILGICRGMQVLAQFFAAKLSPLKGHISTRHTVSFSSASLFSCQNPVVNSFHSQGLLSLASDNIVKPLAICEDGSIEAIRHTTLPICGVLWHPEREKSPTEHDIYLFRQLFG